MSVLIFNQTYAIEFHPTDFSGFKTTPLSLGLMWKYKWENIQKFKKVLFFGYNFCYHKSTSVLIFLSVIDSFGWLWMGSLHKNVQLRLEFLKAPFLVLLFSYYTLITFMTMFICNNIIYVDDITLYCNSDQASDLW